MNTVEIWNPLSLEEIHSLFIEQMFQIWISGGWAIDLFLGQQTRVHEDLDISIDRNSQLLLQQALYGWDLRVSDPPGSGTLRPWGLGEILNSPVYNIWCRKNMELPWNLEVMLCDFQNDQWVYRRNKNIRGPLKEFGWKQDNGLGVIAPEIQLLYKSRSPRDKDNQDLENCLQKFSVSQKEKLKTWIQIDSGKDHPWLLKI